MKKKISLFLILTIFLLFLLSFTTTKVYTQTVNEVDYHNLDYSFKTSTESNFLPYSTLRANLNNSLNISSYLDGKTILIENSIDLYHWSSDLKHNNNFINHNKKQELLSQDYVLGQDIDYSERKSDRFFPIGYFIDGKKLEFNGTFDGRGFEITNLYLAVFEEYHFFDDNNQIKTPAPFFSTFNFVGSNGTIENLGLIDPIIDLENEIPELEYFSYLVGENSGTINNVYVEDTRDINTGGIRAPGFQVSSENRKQAAGIIHTNKGDFNNSYFTGETVVNGEYAYVFLEAPIVYKNDNNIDKIVYDGAKFKTENQNFIGISEQTLQTTSSLDSDIWTYYPNDGYPKLVKLNYNNGFYEINNAVELIYFTKLIKFETVIHNSFNEEKYLIKSDINLDDVGTGAYKTPDVEFRGSFIGEVTVVEGEEIYPQINNISITRSVTIGEEVYYGLFSSFSGSFENIAIYNASIKPDADLKGENINADYFVGFIAGKLTGATVKNVFIKGDMDFEDTLVGAFSIGGIAGIASGHIERVLMATGSKIFIGTQSNYNNEAMKNNFYLGGIIGRLDSNKTTVYNVLNQATITSLNANVNTSSDLNFYFGGVIGYINNPAVSHNIGLITNKGILNTAIVNNTKDLNYYFGGVIGYSAGYAYTISNIYGKWSNYGELNFSNNIDNYFTNFYVAGVLNSNHSQANEFVKLYSDTNFDYSASKYVVSSLINHLSTFNITISQVISKGNFATTVAKDQAIAVYIKEQAPLLYLNYVEVYNDFDIATSSSAGGDIAYAGITLHPKTYFLNVTYGGNIEVDIQSGNVTYWIAGLTKELNHPYYIKNSTNEGSIIVDYNSSSNLYVAGLVNRNISGDLQAQDTNPRPKATRGILNSINLAKIDVKVTSIANAFVGGLVSLLGGTQGGSIQDAINAGDIYAINNNSSVSSSFDEGQNEAGMVTSFSGGIFTGGIVSTITNGSARIYDTSNKGEIIGLAKAFVRSGGILASALVYEIYNNKAKIDSTLYSSTTTVTSAEFISNAIVANGINYGDVQAITQNIAANSSNDSRFGIYSVAGGVIGYGLTTMKRMINHGRIAATDIAGGIVGATNVYRTITVDINTAINYGEIKAIRNAQYSNLLSIVSNRSAEVRKASLTAHLYPDNDPWIIPNNSTRTAPQAKRGFGGVFGRLQRGYQQRMGTSGGSFDFVVNMNPNIDLIGRLDQASSWAGFTGTKGYFSFNQATYYSAKVNDTTQAVFTGDYDARYDNYETTYYDVELITRYVYSEGTRSRYYERKIVSIKYKKLITKREYQISLDGTFREYVEYVDYDSGVTEYQLEDSGDVSINQNDYNRYPAETVEQFEKYVRQSAPPISISWPNNSSGGFLGIGRNYVIKNVPHISETEGLNGFVRYVYDEDFVMRDDSTLIDVGGGATEPITSFIYYAENRLLADHFSAARPNGMYVLASSSGSKYGAVLPKNLNLEKLKKIKWDEAPNNLTYENVDSEHLIGETIVDDKKTSFGNLLDVYESLYQTKVNDRSKLLEEDQRVVMKDGYPTEVFFESNNFTGNEIIFEVNKDLINNANVYTSFFEILQAALPDGALIANSNATQGQLEAFREANLNAIVATGTLAPNLSYNVTSAANKNSLIGTTINLGTFTSFSEAAIYDSNLYDIYKTEYTVKLIIKDQTIADPTLYQVSRDGGAATTNVGGTHNINSDIALTFRENNSAASDANHKLKHGFVIDEFLELYYIDGGNNEKVDKSYYNILSIPKNGRDFTTTVHMGDKLRPGNYQIRYKFYQHDDVKTLNINYTKSYEPGFSEFVPYTSKNYNLVSSNYIADIDFDYNVIIDKGLNVTRTINNQDIPVYAANYYDYQVAFLQRFTKNNFFEFDEIRQGATTIVDGYYRYTLNYYLNNTLVYTNYLQERKLSPNYYKGSISLSKSYNANFDLDEAFTTATREAELTRLILDYQLPQSFYDQANRFSITYTYNGGSPQALSNTVSSLYYQIDNRVNIIMTKEAEPGEYVFNISYTRDSETFNIGRITVTKQLGTSDVLSNIKFSKFVVGNEYPDMFFVNDTNIGGLPSEDIDEMFKIGMYYNGINYDGFEYSNERYFRIDGKVSNIPLNYYMPANMVEYLPIGAGIKRKIYNSDGSFTWSSIVDLNSTPEQIELALSTDYTIDPVLGFTGEKVYIEYMVVSEVERTKPGNQQVGSTYYISVIDVKYNFLASFNFYYKDESGVFSIDTLDLFDKTTILLSLFNYDLSYNGNLLEVGETPVELEDFNLILFDKKEELITKQQMFYYVNKDTKDDYIYQLGSNVSGYYQFKVILPDGYKYKIYLTDYTDEDNLLPEFGFTIEEGEPLIDKDGYLYYINSSSITRTKHFEVVIESTDQDEGSWGITNQDKTWEEE